MWSRIKTTKTRIQKELDNSQADSENLTRDLIKLKNKMKWSNNSENLQNHSYFENNENLMRSPKNKSKSNSLITSEENIRKVILKKMSSNKKLFIKLKLSMNGQMNLKMNQKYIIMKLMKRKQKFIKKKPCDRNAFLKGTKRKFELNSKDDSFNDFDK